jgi:hypothetical protein
MKKWTENEAKSVLMKSGDVRQTSPKTMVIRGGVKGLTACSAMDYLKNYCGYNILVG